MTLPEAFTRAEVPDNTNRAVTTRNNFESQLASLQICQSSENADLAHGSALSSQEPASLKTQAKSKWLSNCAYAGPRDFFLGFIGF